MMPRRLEAYETLRRAIGRGELPGDIDMDVLLDSLYGAIYMRFLIRQQGLTEQYVDQVCDLVLDGARNK
jgi:hypothetical protein